MSSANTLAVAAFFSVGLAAIQVSHAASRPTEAARTAEPNGRSTIVNVIFDTDMWSDIDDALALAMLHALQARHEINLAAVTVSTDEKWCASYVDLIDTFYGHPHVPIGLVRDGLGIDAFRQRFPDIHWPPTRYTQILSQERTRTGVPLYPHRLIDGRKATEAVSLLRKTLAMLPDGSVVVIQVGYSTNLARLLDSTADAASALGGRDLVRKKVRLLAVMAGNFGEATVDGTVDGKALARGSPEFNLQSDVPSAQKVFSDWPSPVVASGYEIGISLRYPAVSIERDFSYVKHHPIAETYHSYAVETSNLWPHDHATFDLTAVLYAVRPDRDYFSLSQSGRITVLPDGGSRFDESEDGSHRYLILRPEQKARALEAMVMLVSQPPAK